MKSTTMMYVDKLLDVYSNDDSSKRAQLWEKHDANKITHYGCRYYENQIFAFDEFYPNKSIHWAENCANNWVEGIKKR
jgi:hypothetical protein|tara:strand:- start:368 stop:601 length:234 start_codon:yes stop_codon:yes gene_type:complete